MKDELLDRVETEAKLRSGDLFGGVLMATLEARKAGDTHHKETVTVADVGHGCLLRDRDLDTVAHLHHANRELVARVETHLDTLGDDRLGLLGGEVATLDRALAGGKHVVRDPEPEKCTHVVPP